MLSSTYQQRSDTAARRGCERDPENRLVWRFNRQRLDFESMRDSLLAVSGALDPTIGGRPVAITEPPFSRPAHGLRLHRPPEPRRPLPHLRLRRAGRDQPAAVRDDGAAAGPLPDEQPVPARAGRAGWPRRSARIGVRPTRPTASAGSTAACSSAGRPSPTSWPGRRVPPPPGRPADSVDAGRLEARSRDRKAEPPLSPWEQLSQVLLLTNEFMFVD